MISDLPLEILHAIASNLNFEDFSRLRQVVQLEWGPANIKKYAKVRLNAFRTTPCWPKRCVVCGDQVISHIYWKRGVTVAFVPWCTLHIDDTILKDVDMYCVRGLGIDVLN